MSSLVTTSAVDNGVVIVTLNRAEKKNALSIALRDEFTACLAALAADEHVRVVIITGAGSVFCAGFDLSEFAVDDADHQAALWQSSDRFHHALLRFALPTIAAVNGPALAGGFDLAVLCDLRIAASTARFAHPEHAWGDVVYRPLRELVGGALARDLALTGRSINAEQAFACGLVSAVVAPDALLDEAVAIATQIAAAPRAVLRRTKAKIIAAGAISPETPTLDL